MGYGAHRKFEGLAGRFHELTLADRHGFAERPFHDAGYCGPFSRAVAETYGMSFDPGVRRFDYKKRVRNKK